MNVRLTVVGWWEEIGKLGLNEKLTGVLRNAALAFVQGKPGSRVTTDVFRQLTEVAQIFTFDDVSVCFAKEDERGNDCRLKIVPVDPFFLPAHETQEVWTRLTSVARICLATEALAETGNLGTKAHYGHIGSKTYDEMCAELEGFPGFLDELHHRLAGCDRLSGGRVAPQVRFLIKPKGC